MMLTHCYWFWGATRQGMKAAELRIAPADSQQANGDLSPTTTGTEFDQPLDHVWKQILFLSLQIRPQAGWPLGFQLWGTLSREPSTVLLYFWPRELWGNKWMLIYTSKFVVIYFAAT